MNYKKQLFSGFLFVVFFQLLTSFIETIYSLCLLRQEITIDLLGLLFLFLPLLFFFLPKKSDTFYAKLFIAQLILCRVGLGFFEPSVQLIISGLGTGTFLLLMPWLFKWLNVGKDGFLDTVMSICIALFLLVMFKSIGSSLDITLNKFVGFSFLVLLFFNRDQNIHSESGDSDSNFTILPTLFGISSILILIYFAFASPVVFSRWSEMDYLLVLALFLTPLFFLVFSLMVNFGGAIRFIQKNILFLNVFFCAALITTICLQQIDFPNTIEAFPIASKKMQWFHYIPQVTTLLLWPIILIDLAFFSKNFKDFRFTDKKYGLYVTLAVSTVLILHIFGHNFTAVWGYVPPVSTIFKDAFWLVHLSPCLILIGSLFICLKGKANPAWKVHRKLKGVPVFITLLIVGGLTLGSVYLVSANPAETTVPKRLKLMTFNIQQGTNIQGNKSYDDQLGLIKAYNPDVIALQECDPVRISGGNFDIVRYFADKLNYYSYYGASPVTGTFGVSLLSRYPIVSSRTHFLASEYEQVAMTESKIKVGDHYFNVSVNHPAGTHNYKLAQVTQILDIMKDKANVICMGDFNLRPDSEYYDTITKHFVDTWNNGTEDVTEKERCSPIDHIFVSPNIKILNSSCINTTYSDHNVVCAEIKIPDNE